jgi:hypothetical protein
MTSWLPTRERPAADVLTTLVRGDTTTMSDVTDQIGALDCLRP